MPLLAQPNPILVPIGTTMGDTLLQWSFPGESVSIYAVSGGLISGPPLWTTFQTGQLTVIGATSGSQYVAYNQNTHAYLQTPITITLVNAASLPLLPSGYVSFYGTQFATRFNTGVVRFESDEEQRWVRRRGLAAFSLVYKDVATYDKNLMLEFFISKKGRSADVSLSNCFDVTWDGTTYHYCLFNMDKFESTEDQLPNRHSFKLDIVQVRL